jgi:porin
MRVGTVLVVFLLQLGPSPARAQQQPAQSTVGLATLQPSATAAIYPALYSPPFGTEHALGDWAGARTWLEDHGVDIGLNYFAEPAAIVAGGQRQGIDYTSQIGLSVDLDGQKLLGLTGFALHAAIVQLNGRSSSADFLHDDLDAVQQIFGGGGDVAAHLVYLYGEQVLDNGRVDAAAGRLPVGAYFAGSPLYCDFLNVIFCGHPHPLPIYPAEPKWPAALGHYKVGFDEDTSSYPDLFRNTNGQPISVSGLPGQPHNGRRMYYVLVDQMLVRTGKSDTDGLIVFGGAVHADHATSPLENQVFGGVVSTASFIGRLQDNLGFAASWFQVSGALTATQELEQALDEPLTGGGLLASSLGVPVGVQSHEAELEAEYTAKVYRGVFITPDIQYIINPDGTSRIRNALCVALQINATF